MNYENDALMLIILNENDIVKLNMACFKFSQKLVDSIRIAYYVITKHAIRNT
jgi:hypothetical protein